MEACKVVNCVFRGSLSRAINLKEVCFKVNSTEEKVAYHLHPHMLCVKKKGASLHLFPSGRFRIMGSRYTTCESALNWFTRLSDGKLFTKYLKRDLILQTQTVTLKTTRECAKRIFEKYPHDINFEPELFTAMKIIKWSDVHINMFFTGKVIILGRCSLERSREVRQWLCQIERETMTSTTLPLLTTISSSSSSSFVKRHEEAIAQLLFHLPLDLHVLAVKYFQSYPAKLIISWSNRMMTGEREALVSQLSKCITTFVVTI